MALVTVNGEQVEVSLSDIVLDENQIILDKNNPPKGWFTQAQLDAKVKEINKTKTTKAKEELRSDTEFHQEVLSQYNISLGEDGKPKGLKPDFDPQEWIQKKSQELTKPLKDELDNFKSRYERAKRARIEDAILAATKGQFKDEFTTSKDEGRVKPIVVNQFRDLFDENDDGKIVLKDADGHWARDINGHPVTPGKYLSDAEKFGDWMIDKRQRGSGFQNGGTGSKPRFTEAQISKMSDAEYEKHRNDILEASADGRVD